MNEGEGGNAILCSVSQCRLSIPDKVPRKRGQKIRDGNVIIKQTVGLYRKLYARMHWKLTVNV